MSLCIIDASLLIGKVHLCRESSHFHRDSVSFCRHNAPFYHALDVSELVTSPSLEGSSKTSLPKNFKKYVRAFGSKMNRKFFKNLPTSTGP